MCEAARDAGVKVILSGMGADELFGGYRKHLACVMAARYRRLPGLPRAGVRRAVDRAPGGARRTRAALRPVGQALPDLRRAARGSRVPPQLHPLRPGRAGRAAEPGPRRPRRRDHRASTARSTTTTALHDQVNRMCLADSRMFLPGLNLAYTDRASMAASIEVRVPFVDPVVARAAFSLPGRDKIRGRQGKVALKEPRRPGCPRDRPPAQGLVQRAAAGLGAARPARAHRRRARRGRARRVRVSPRRRAGPPHRGRAGGPRGPLQADLAAADPGAVVPRTCGSMGRRRPDEP